MRYSLPCCVWRVKLVRSYIAIEVDMSTQGSKEKLFETHVRQSGQPFGAVSALACYLWHGGPPDTLYRRGCLVPGPTPFAD